MRWERLKVARGWALSLAGFGSLSTAGFLLDPVAGWSAVGLSLLLIEWLSQPREEAS